jgi:hypothetical protein
MDLTAGAWLVLTAMARPESTAGEAKMPDQAAVLRVVQSQLAPNRDRRDGDILSKGDVIPVFDALEKNGWTVADRDAILKKVLDENDSLVQLLRTPAGKRFMRQVSGYRLIYDRLDRIARVSGGEIMIRDLVKLPDGEKYARFPPARVLPDLLDLLPKERSAKRRAIPDYEKPTGKIYTVKDFTAQIEKSHEEAKQPKPPDGSPGKKQPVR